MEKSGITLADLHDIEDEENFQGLANINWDEGIIA